MNGRIEIEKMLCLKKNLTEIALALNYHKSTISREVNAWP
jgi:IS30 family transposase